MTENWIDLLPKEETKPSFDWSQYQKDIFDFVENGSGNAVVEAVAGSGKTSTILEALNYVEPHLKTAFVAFNKTIATELKSRAPSYVDVSTLHSLGFKQMRSQYAYAHGSNPINNDKMRIVFDEYVDGLKKTNGSLVGPMYKNWKQMGRLCSLYKATLLPITEDSLDHIAERYQVLFDGLGNRLSFGDIVNATSWMINKSNSTLDWMIDFDDMIYAPAAGFVECEKFDWLFVDEAQDLNSAQLQFVLKSSSEDGRVIAVGDRHQSIYSFRGADSSAIPNIITFLDAKILPLNVTYRCPTKVVSLAKRYVPHIEARTGAPAGYVGSLFDVVREGDLKPDDLVLSRTNLPLISPVLELLGKGVNCVILGRDIGTGLIVLVNAVQKKYSSADARSFMRDMSLYQVFKKEELFKGVEINSAEERNSERKYQAILEKIETVRAVARQGFSTVAEIKNKISKIFSDNKRGIVFSTIHKAKGTEADRVFILGATNGKLEPHPLAIQPWELETERNIAYVAVTRAKKELYFIEEGF